MAETQPLDLSKFHIVTMISNPVNFKSRLRLYNEFKARMAEQGITVWTCEVAQGELPFQITRAGDPHVLQLRTIEELWMKEVALEQIIQQLPFDWAYVAWVDADIAWLDTTGENAWYNQAMRALQTYEVVQLWQNCIDLGPEGEVLQTHQGFVYAYINGKMQKKKGYGAYAHPGYAWAMNRSVYDRIGLYTMGILGSGDNAMAYAFINRVLESAPSDISDGYKKSLLEYQDRCERWVRRDIGYIPCTIMHYYHGKKKNRFYDTRWKILSETQYDPYSDIHKDYQGLWRLDDRNDEKSIKLRDRIRAYFRSRREDSIDVE